jgi:prepilin-type N-terminal cleavage/methylation domain-containing protein
MVSAKHKDDAGFTLTELIIVVGMISFILAVAWATFALVVRGRDTVDTQSWLTREVGAPLELAERVFIQQHAIDKNFLQLGDYACACWTDMDDDGRDEYWLFTATTDGKLTVTTYEEIDNPVARTTVWSEHNSNRAEGVPLFDYVNINGQPIDDTTRISSDAKSMRITIVTEREGRVLSDSRYVQFRNR